MNDKVKFIERKSKPFPTIGQSIWVVVLLFILIIIVYGPFKAVFLKHINRDIQFPILYLLTFGLILLYLYRKWKKEDSGAKFNFKIQNYRILPILLVVATAIFIVNIFIISSIPMSDSMKEYLREIFEQTGIFTLLTAVIIVPIFEELIFRGIILDGFLKQYSPIKSIIISSLIFGIVHFNPWQFAIAFLGGLFIGWIYYKTQSVSLAIFIHFINNATGTLGGIFDEENYIDATPIEMFGGMTNSILLITTAIIIIITTIYYLNEIFSKEYST